MAEEFQDRICGENWWNIESTRSCSVAANDVVDYSTWQTDIMDLKATRSSAEDTNNLVSDSYMGFVDAQKPHKSESASGSGSILIDSTLQMMGFGLSSSTTTNLNRPLFRCNNGRPESNFHSMLQEETDINSSNSQIQRDWSTPKSFSSGNGSQVSTIDTSKPMNQEFSFGLSDRDFPIGLASYGCPSTLKQSLHDPDPQPHPQPQHSLFTNRSMSYSSKANYGTPSNELLPIWSKVSSFLKPLPMAKQHPIGLHFSNNTPFWNPSAEALTDIRAGAFAPSQSQYQTPTFEEKPNCSSTLLNKLKSEEKMDLVSMVKKSVCEPESKRPRMETPSPLPTFKVRKEKLGDRVTALQQLVSPFGKTDTASVLHEANEYIKFLHDQVSVLSSPYIKNGAPIQQGCDDLRESEGPKQDLRSRGLCLVPTSNTFPVASETTTDFWKPTFGGALLR
ncbi:transcription factor bHLH112-like [Gastrolobium bilobum]|uniref:transcription factor bHLH112-like n=1 Tax=Gastrolobium bilobum TaxID=150636 RepID=UPI002AB306CD|nr:transcription factor bHLH112-like [Gastrolobium bilobum]